MHSQVHFLFLVSTDHYSSYRFVAVLQVLASKLVHYQTDQNLQNHRSQVSQLTLAALSMQVIQIHRSRQSHHFPAIILHSVVLIRLEFLQSYQSHRNLQIHPR